MFPQSQSISLFREDHKGSGREILSSFEVAASRHYYSGGTQFPRRDTSFRGDLLYYSVDTWPRNHLCTLPSWRLGDVAYRTRPVRLIRSCLLLTWLFLYRFVEPDISFISVLLHILLLLGYEPSSIMAFRSENRKGTFRLFPSAFMPSLYFRCCSFVVNACVRLSPFVQVFSLSFCTPLFFLREWVTSDWGMEENNFDGTSKVICVEFT